jgi:hypothetical protein
MIYKVAALWRQDMLLGIRKCRTVRAKMQFSGE